MFKLVLEKSEEPEIKLPTSDGSSKKQESSRFIDYEQALVFRTLRSLKIFSKENIARFFKKDLVPTFLFIILVIPVVIIHIQT